MKRKRVQHYPHRIDIRLSTPLWDKILKIATDRKTDVSVVVREFLEFRFANEAKPPMTCPIHNQPRGTIYKDGSVEHDCNCRSDHE